MMTIFNTRSVYIGSDLNRFNEIRNYLDTHQIRYKYKVRNHGGHWSGTGTQRGRTGSFGIPSEQMYEYEILVHEKDCDRIQL
ncbi:MAG: hypothetical protein ACOX7K_04230 [Oscillospiraceae bacterium]